MSNNPAVRIPPSGAFLRNAQGAMFKPGPGAQLRLVEAQTTIGGQMLIPTTPTQIAHTMGSSDFFLVLPAPETGFQYRVDVKIDVLNLDSNPSYSAELYLDLSIDSTFSNLASPIFTVRNTHPIGLAGRQLSLSSGLFPGSLLQLPDRGLVNLYARARIGAASGGGVLQVSSKQMPDGSGSNGTVLLSLAECY